MEANVNYLAVLAAAVASMFVGFVWYGFLFRKTWMELMGITPESIKGSSMSANKAYAIQFVASLITACVLSQIMFLVYASSPGSTPLEAGMVTGLLAWLGFAMPVTLGIVLWEGKPWKLWLINASHYLVGLVVMGVVLSFWM